VRVPNHIRADAAEAFTENIAWPAFVAEYGHLLREAEPYSIPRYRRLRELALSIVTSGSTGGMFGCGDLNDSRAEWFDDAEPVTQSTIFDTSEAYQ